MGRPIRNDSDVLWGNYLQGDRAALKELINRYNDVLLMFLLGKTKNREIAKEIAQETWLKMAKHKKGIKNFKAYLYKVASNAWIDMCTKNSKIKSVEKTTSSINGIAVKPEVFYKLREEDITKMYRSCLTDGEYELWKLHCEGYNSEEICKRLSIQRKTVDNKKSMIRKKLMLEIKNLTK
ncbi:sigma-70 family RNA polymerase sigma factor [Flagellimonas hymeniacidonis]|uniref:RNA polymerase sigma factor SigS n=1 Tax=Flagellimonas hymeniacidonis TaxID=2603628 RepID=A0A5C8VB11_9FLAO|nr:sigma-70 family RNA polymerase sigma factor [Flagellimonas hymeniacidonis]TXN38290.1 sigma-70 family RNA polymerase sigma factor [Flagellimonas hymeniacidonis]